MNKLIQQCQTSGYSPCMQDSRATKTEVHEQNNAQEIEQEEKIFN